MLPAPYRIIRQPRNINDGHYVFADRDGNLFLADHSINTGTLDPASCDDGLLRIELDRRAVREKDGDIRLQVYVHKAGKHSTATVSPDTYTAIVAANNALK
jgi:hypothetical protein